MLTPCCRYLKVALLVFFLTASTLSPVISYTQQTIDIESLEDLALDLQRKGSYDSSILIQQQILDYHRKQDDRDNQIIALLAICESNRKLTNYQESLRILDTCLVLAEKSISQEVVLSKIYQAAGTLYLSMMRLDTALYLLERSIDISSEAGIAHKINHARTYNNIGNYYFYKRKFDSALVNYRKAYDIALSRNDSVSGDFASACQNMGIIYANSGYYDMAERYLQTSLDIKKILFGRNSISLARTHFNIANFFLSISKLDSAYINLNHAEQIYRTHFSSDHSKIAQIYLVKGNYFNTKGDYDKALVYFQNALNIYNKYPESYLPTIQSLQMNIGYIYEKKNDFDLAVNYYTRAIEDESNPIIVKAYRNIASVYSKMGKFERANDYYLKSISYAQKLIGDYNQDIALCYLYFGESLLLQSNEPEGVNYLFKAKKTFEKIFGKKNRDVAKINTIIGNYYQNSRQIDSALIFYQRSLVSSIDHYRDSTIYGNPTFDQITPDLTTLKALIEKAFTLFLKYRSTENDTSYLHQSYRTYDLTTRLIDTIRNTFQTEESKLFLSNANRKVLTDYLAVVHEIYSISNDTSYFMKMIRLAESSKASLLVDALQQTTAEDLGRVPKELLNQEQALQLNIGFYSEKIHEELGKEIPDRALIDLWNNLLYKYKLDLEDLNERLEADYPLYSAFKYSNSTADLSTIRASILPGESVVEYVLTDTVLYIFVINSSYTDCITQSIDSQLQKEILSLDHLIKNSPTLNYKPSDFKEFIKRSHYLFDQLIKPVRSLIIAEKIVIIPDAELNFVSFDVLLQDTLTLSADNYRDLNYLINDFTIRYSYSISLISTYQETNPGISDPHVIAFAPEYSNNTMNYDTSRQSGEILFPLPYAVEEVQNILDYYPGTSYTGAEANEGNFIREAPEYEVIHLAMHTLIDNDNPLFSKLVFSSQEDSLREGYLNIYELYNIGLNGHMAVLSACNTGSGKLEKGEGVMSLARAFTYAGIPSVIMTLWTVEDQSGSMIMADYYKYLSQGQLKNAALRQAKLDYLEEASKIKSHPYFWGGYVCIGDTSPLIKSNNNLLYIILASLVILSGLYLILALRKKRRKAPIP